MKSLTTRMVERAVARHDAPADPLASVRASAAAQLHAPVIDAALFSRRVHDTARRIAGSPNVGGPLARLALRKFQQVQAGGLPPHFLLAVTADEVVALERTISSHTRDSVGEPGPEVARWRRDDLTVDVHDNGHLLDVTLTSARENEQVKCTVAKHSCTEAFLVLLGARVGVPA